MTLLLSYLVVLLLSVTVAGVFYCRMEEIMINHAIRTNTGLLKQLNQDYGFEIEGSGTVDGPGGVQSQGQMAAEQCRQRRAGEAIEGY
ncbi:hypothetical protein PMJ10TS2_35000 [Paenibacillus melissococcoides]